MKGLHILPLKIINTCKSTDSFSVFCAFHFKHIGLPLYKGDTFIKKTLKEVKLTIKITKNQKQYLDQLLLNSSCKSMNQLIGNIIDKLMILN